MFINPKLFFTSRPKADQAFESLADITTRIVRTFVVISLITGTSVQAADHGDHLLERDNTNLTDLYVFTRGEGTEKKLVIIVNTNPNATIPLPENTEEDYVFPSDLTLTINIDENSEVVDLDPTSELGGTIANPSEIQEDTTFTVTFNGDCMSMQQPEWNTSNNTICLNLTESNYGVAEFRYDALK